VGDQKGGPSRARDQLPYVLKHIFSNIVFEGGLDD